MSTPCTEDVTLLLHAWSEGEASALKVLVPRVYAELHRLAHSYMKSERPGHALQTTALVNEAYLRLASAKPADCPDRRYFYGVCARVMRQVLVDWARSQRSSKRQANWGALELHEAGLAASEPDADLVAINDALEALAVVDPRKAQIVELRFFGGFSVEETANALGVSPGTVARDWTIAKLFLRRELTRRSSDQDHSTIKTRHENRTLG